MRFELSHSLPPFQIHAQMLWVRISLVGINSFVTSRPCLIGTRMVSGSLRCGVVLCFRGPDHPMALAFG